MITLPHFSPGQGKCPGWWTSTWWAFIFPENFFLKIGSFDYFLIYQLIIFPEKKIYHLHKSSKMVIDVDNYVIHKNMEITSNVIFGITGTPDLGFHQDFPPFVKNLFPHSGHGTPWPFGGTLAIIWYLMTIEYSSYNIRSHLCKCLIFKLA